MKIVYASNFNELSGFSEASRGYRLLMPRETEIVNIQIEGTNKYNIKNTINSVPDEDYILVWHANPVVMYNAINGRFNMENGSFLGKLMQRSTKNVSINAWETNELPKSHLDLYRLFETRGAIVPSEYNLEIYRDHLNTIKLHHIVEKKKSEPYMEKVLSDKKFFLSISQWNYRKNFEDLLFSYFLEFKNQDVVLVLKTYLNHANSGRKQIQDKILEIKKSISISQGCEVEAKVLLLTDYISEEQKHYLLQNCSAYCGTSISEGFGLSYAEAACYRKPIVAPNRGAQSEYLSKDFLFDTVIDHYRGPNGYGYDHEMMVNYPIIKSVREKMRKAFETKKKYDNILQTKEEIREGLRSFLEIIGEKNTD